MSYIVSQSVLVITKDGVTINGNVTEQRALVNSGKFTNIQSIGTATELIVFPADLIAEGVSEIMLKNMDLTNFIEIGLNTPLTQIFAKLLPGQTCKCAVNKVPTADPTWYAKADTLACNLQIVAAGT